MVKKLLILFLLLPCFAQAQDTLDLPTQYFEQTAAKVFKATWPTKVRVDTLTQTVNTLNAIATVQGQSIKDLQTQVAGINIVTPPVPRVIWDNAYTLTESDNGAVLAFPTTATITCPTLFAGFKVKIIRTGASSSAVVTINGASSVYGYKRLTLQFADCEINYITNSQPILTGRISK